MKTLFKVLVLLCSLSAPAVAQILNTDGIGRPVDSTHVLNAAIDFGMALNKQNTMLLSFDSKADVSYLHLHNILIFVGNFSFLRSGTENLINGGFSHLRYRMSMDKVLQPEVFGQFQLDNIRGMKRRMLGGANMRFRILEKKDVSLFAAIGAMYEYEHWDYSGIKPGIVIVDNAPIDNHFIKMNTYISYRQKLGEWAQFSAILYFQTRPDSYFSVPRISSDAQLRFKISKHVGFSVSYNVFFDAAPPVPTYNWYYSVVNKIIFTF